MCYLQATNGPGWFPTFILDKLPVVIYGDQITQAVSQEAQMFCFWQVKSFE